MGKSHAYRLIEAAGVVSAMSPMGDIPANERQLRGMKHKGNLPGDIYVPQSYDACQTPAYALDPLLPFITRRGWRVWEPAAGAGLLVEGLYDAGFVERQVIGTDILTGQNFFEYEPGQGHWDVLVTNPPFSIKYEWLKRCYELGKPWALLMPVEMLGAQTAQAMFARYGLQLMLLDKRVDFRMPKKGFAGSAQFPTAWFTWGLDLGAQIVFATITKGK